MWQEPAWDEEAAGMPDPWAHLRGGISPYGPEGEILGVGHFAGGVRRATGWRRTVGVGVAALVVVALLGFQVVTALEVAGGRGSTRVVQPSSRLP